MKQLSLDLDHQKGDCLFCGEYVRHADRTWYHDEANGVGRGVTHTACLMKHYQKHYPDHYQKHYVNGRAD